MILPVIIHVPVHVFQPMDYRMKGRTPGVVLPLYWISVSTVRSPCSVVIT